MFLQPLQQNPRFRLHADVRKEHFREVCTWFLCWILTVQVNRHCVTEFNFTSCSLSKTTDLKLSCVHFLLVMIGGFRFVNERGSLTALPTMGVEFVKGNEKPWQFMAEDLNWRVEQQFYEGRG